MATDFYFIIFTFTIFKAPVPIRPWNGIYNARNYGKKCPTLEDIKQLPKSQLKNTDVEDCLNMAIFSKNVCDFNLFPKTTYLLLYVYNIERIRMASINFLVERIKSGNGLHPRWWFY